MRNQLQIFQKSKLFYPLMMLILAGILYLFMIDRIGFFYDDWYLIYDGHTQGPTVYQEVFKMDRPARAYLQEAAYSLFGNQVIYYKLSSFVFRYFSALAFYWVLNQVSRKQKHSNFLTALFFLIYPGFLRQVTSIDYLAHLLSLCLAMFSIALTIKVIQANSIKEKIGFWIAAVILGWIYLGLMEYYIGLEFLRLLFIYLIATNSMKEPPRKTLSLVFAKWLPFLLIPMGFLIWRLFFFSSTRAATDAGFQIGIFLSSPLHTGFWWIIHMVLSFLNTVFFAWVVPFYTIMNLLRLKEILLIFGIATSLVAFVLLLFFKMKTWDQSEEDQDNNNPNLARVFLMGGVLAVVAGLLPIILVNREVTFEDYSRYTLPALPGVAMLLMAFFQKLVSQRARLFVLGMLVFITSATHLGNSINFANQTEAFRNFWWQVSWRAPQIQPGTTLTAIFPLTGVNEDYIIWGPANLIYYPNRQVTVPINIPLPAVSLEGVNFSNILAQSGDSEYTKRGNTNHIDNRSLLVLTQGLSTNCVRILDGNASELSIYDDPRIMLISPFSKVERILIEEQPAIPPESIFGPEPKHTWCYYYEKAALARQQLDWVEVIRLLDQAKQNKFGPLDRIEWLPLLQAYVATGQEDKLAPFVSIMLEENFIRSQSCEILKYTAQKTRPEDYEMQAYIGSTFCK